MNNLSNWQEVTMGIYRNVVAAKVAYEIHIVTWNKKTDINQADAKLYIVGEWNTPEGTKLEREHLCTSTVEDCLEKAVQDNKENNQ